MKVSAFPAITKRVDILTGVNYFSLEKKQLGFSKMHTDCHFFFPSLHFILILPKLGALQMCQDFTMLVGRCQIHKHYETQLSSCFFLTVLYSAVGRICCHHIPMYQLIGLELRRVKTILLMCVAGGDGCTNFRVMRCNADLGKKNLHILQQSTLALDATNETIIDTFLL